MQRSLFWTTLLAFLLLAAAKPDASVRGTLEKLHELNFAAQSVGELASRRAQTVPVRAYGKMLQLDHEKADREVLALAREKGLALTSTAKLKQDQPLMDRLKAAAGSTFDIEFTEAMVDAHRRALTAVKEAQKHEQDAALKRFLNDQGAMLERHLRVGEDLEKEALAH